ncbi:aminoglycoside phosphotransferase [Streptomyces sp. NPDC018031]|uniref:aminoglycoside phosphotransferase n=1 Tax=Streptomyces sp. NPDC018031 TaxID=3365033 RepID=UPI0037B6C1D4
MPMERVPWGRMPTEVRSAVSRELGGESTVEDLTAGGNSAMASLFTLVDGRQVFVKGMPGDHEQAGELELERRINPHLPESAPRLLWQVEAAGWTLLGFEGVAGGAYADFTVGSADLGRVVGALSALGVQGTPPPWLPTAWGRWGSYCSSEDEPLLTGETIAHTDPAAVNFLIGDGRAYLTDWAWPLVGPAWVDPTLWAMRLIVDGEQTPAEAYAWASKIPSFRGAPPRALAVLAEAEARSWEHHHTHGVPGIESHVEGARAWADHLA